MFHSYCTFHSRNNIDIVLFVSMQAITGIWNTRNHQGSIKGISEFLCYDAILFFGYNDDAIYA